MALVLVISVAVVAYVYAGYPAALWLLVRLRGERRVARAAITPRASLVISAFNEADVIRQKLENAVALRYPKEALEIVVVSDASDDGTDDIVREFAGRGVRLARHDDRLGKTAGLNRVLPTLTGDIVVFSDANAMYEPDALLKLARNFADPEVGCATGEARYLAQGRSTADTGERTYWNYEIRLKQLETALGSMVGGDGAIYAIRRGLWRTLPVDAINDFLNPLQIVGAGWRGVYEPEAICYEATAGDMHAEFRRRVRIVSRSWRAVFQADGVRNPFRVGLFAWSLVSHKILRWWSGIFVAAAAIAAALMAWPVVAARPAAGAGLAIAAALILAAPAGRRAGSMVVYFAVINAASLVGLARGSLGRVSGVWTTPRQHVVQPASGRVLMVPVWRILQLGAALALVLTAASCRARPGGPVAELVFAVAVGLLAYVYAGYPIVLSGLRAMFRRPARQAHVEPRVALLIAANDEGGIIEAKLQNALAVDYPAGRLEIVVVSDGSIDETNARVREFAPRVRLIELQPRRGKMAAINVGMAAIETEIVVLSDANTMLDPQAVRALVRNFADEEVGAVSGDVVLTGPRASLALSEDLYYRYERWMQRAESDVGSMIGADGALYAIRRALFVPQPDDTILDDLAIPMTIVRSGHRVVFEGAARALEQGSESAKEEFSRKARVIAGAMQFMRRSGSAVPVGAPQVLLSLVSHKALRWLSPAFVAAAFVASLLLADRSIGHAAARLALGALLVLGIAGCVPSLRRLPLVAIAHYVCLVQVAAAVGLFRGLTGHQSVLWRRFARTRAPVGGGASAR